MWDKIKQHPWLYSGLAAVIFVIVYWYSSSGSSGASTGSSQADASLQAEASLEATQQQINGQVAQGQLQLQATQDSNAASVQVATLQSQTTNNANSLAAAVAELQAELGSKTTIAADTLQSKVDIANINANEQLGIAQQKTQAQEYATLANALIGEAALSAQTSQAAIAASACHGFFC